MLIAVFPNFLEIFRLKPNCVKIINLPKLKCFLERVAFAVKAH